MSKKFIYWLALCACICQKSLAESFTIEKVILDPKEVGVLSFVLNNVTEYTAFQMDVMLPDGINLKTNEKGEYICSLEKSRFSDSHQVTTIVKVGDRTYRVLSYSSTNLPLLGNQGSILSLPFTVDERIADGDYSVHVNHIRFTSIGNEGHSVGTDFKDVSVSVTVARPVTVTAKSYFRVYGEQNPKFEYETEGAVLKGMPEMSCNATENSPIGTYPIIIKKGGVENYNDSYINGTLTITKAPLTITTESYTRKQGEENPVFAVSYGGWKNGETEAVLNAKPTVTCKAEPSSAPGVYDISVSGAEAQNYDIKYVTGKLTVTKADPVKVTAKSYTRVYGEANPTFEYDVEGAALDGKPEITCEATESSPVGTYKIIIKKGGVTNYNDTYVNGTLTITEAPLTITAKSMTVKQGENIPTLVAVYEGFKNGETEEVLTRKPTLRTTARSSSSVGEYEITVSGASAKNYDITYVKGILTVTDADLVTVTAKSYSRFYGDANPEFEYTAEGADLQGKPSLTCSATASSSVGEYPITVKKGTVTNYNTKLVNGVLTINKALLTVTAKSYTRKQGEKNPTFEITYEGWKRKDKEAVLTQKPVVTCEATETSAPGEYDIVVSGGEAQNYEFKYVAGKLTVTEADAVKVTAQSYTRIYGAENPAFKYEVEGAALDGKPEIICEATATSPVGTYPIIIKKGGVKNYNDTYVDGVLTITKAPLTVTAQSYTRKQGEKNPEFAVSYEGFVNGETETVLTALPTISCEATDASKPGKYDIVVSGADAANYAISYVTGKLTVTEAHAVKVTAKSYTRVYGEDNPAFEYEVEGAALDGKPEISCEATATSPVGTYPIMIKKGGVKNYNDSYVNGVLTITKALLTITAQSYTRKQGEKNPEFAVSYEGFVNGETETVLTKQPTVSCKATESSKPGEYDIVVSGGEAQNYEFKYVAGKLTVTDADAVIVTAKNYTRVYGEDNPTFDYEVEGVALDGKPEISCEATATSSVGIYPIVIKKGGVKNYNDSYVNGVLTITKAPLTVTVGSYTKRQYDAMPEFVVCYEGFVNGETETVLRKLPTVSCEAEKDSQPGEYVITMNGAEAGNYEISYVAGKLTILEPDGISNATHQKPYIVRICSVGGKPRKELQKGVNIVVMSDGTTRTVLIK